MQGFDYNLPKDWTAKIQNVEIKTQMAIKHQNSAAYGCAIHLLQRMPTATITPAIQWLEETNCSLAIKAREQKVRGGT